jgi:hypothetical protein
MAAKKRDVEKLNNESTLNRRLTAGGAQGFGDLLDTLILQVNRLSNGIIGAPALAIGTGATTAVKIIAAFQYKIDGVYYKRIAASTEFALLPTTVLADGFARKWLLLIDAAGTQSVLASDDRLTADVAKCVFPVVPKGKCVVGTVQVATAAATFTPGTTALSAGTATVVYADGMPAGVDGPPTIALLV